MDKDAGLLEDAVTAIRRVTLGPKGMLPPDEIFARAFQTARAPRKPVGVLHPEEAARRWASIQGEGAPPIVHDELAEQKWQEMMIRAHHKAMSPMTPDGDAVRVTMGNSTWDVQHKRAYEEVIKAGSVDALLGGLHNAAAIAADPGNRGVFNDVAGSLAIYTNMSRAKKKFESKLSGSRLDAVRRLEAMKGHPNGTGPVFRRAMDDVVNAGIELSQSANGVGPGRSPMDTLKQQAIEGTQRFAKKHLGNYKQMIALRGLLKRAAVNPAIAERVIGGVGGAALGGAIGSQAGFVATDSHGKQHPGVTAAAGAAIGGAAGAFGVGRLGAAGRAHAGAIAKAKTNEYLVHHLGMPPEALGHLNAQALDDYVSTGDALLTQARAAKERSHNPFGLSYNLTSPRDIHRAFFQ